MKNRARPQYREKQREAGATRHSARGEEAPGTGKRGRPRSNAVDRAIMEAALNEFLEQGFHAMSMESIAARAGVSKVSLYRRWKSKTDATADVFRLFSETKPVEDHGSLKLDIHDLLKQSTTRDVKSAARLLMRTMGEISGNDELLGLYRRCLLAPRIEQLRTILKRACSRGELRPDVAIDLACAMIAGPLFLYYLVVLAEAKVNLPRNLAEQLTEMIMRAVARRPNQPL